MVERGSDSVNGRWMMVTMVVVVVVMVAVVVVVVVLGAAIGPAGKSRTRRAEA